MAACEMPGRSFGLSTSDDLGNLLTVTDLVGTADAVTTTYTYEPAYNQVATVTESLEHTTTFAYDDRG